MSDSPAAAPFHLVLLVHDDPGVTEALSITLESMGASPVQVARAADARAVVQAAPALSAVICRCHLDADEEPPLLAWVGEQRPDVALILLCSTPGHVHEHLPAWCQILGPPFDGTDVKRALIEARLLAFEGWKTD